VPDTPGSSCAEVLPGGLQDLEMLVRIIRPELVHHPSHQVLLFCKVLQSGPLNKVKLEGR
jgi:hypothetical protein